MINGKKLTELPPSVGVDEEKCINCHACIAACPVKFCNDGSGDAVTVNPYMCIGCGNCIGRCTHGARYWVDDFDAFIEDLHGGQKIIAIVAPSVVANFPSVYLNLNGWLKSIGIQAVFDVSFGAELTVKSYIEYLKSDYVVKPVISQPCPAIVTYIEMYLPQLLPYLAPIDSPMVHTMKMIRRYYPAFEQYRIAVLSQCLAKKREFFQTGMGDYNVGFSSIHNYIQKNTVDLSRYPQEQYINPPAERAVGFSSPGGLLKTAERWSPGISQKARKIEGTEHIYEYLGSLSDSIRKKTAPLIIDCLNCNRGCNGGPLTITAKKPLDDVEASIVHRSRHALNEYGLNDQHEGFALAQRTLNDLISKFWESDIYSRQYEDLSINNRIIVPGENELKKIYKIMRKNGESDFYNCNACGYGTCEHMAIAIYNGLNRPENCHFYLTEEAKLKTADISENEKRLRTILSTTTAGFCLADNEFKLIVVNPAFCQVVGSDREKLIGSVFLKKQFERCSTGNSQTSEIRINRPDGSAAYFLLIANPYFDEHKNLVGYFAMVVDVSRYKKDTNGTSVPGFQ